MIFNSTGQTGTDIYTKMLSDSLPADLGHLYENAVAQIIAGSEISLYYHTWDKENSTHYYEVDFLLSRGNKLVPTEVKSSGYKTHKSLDEFCEKYSSHIGERILLYTKDYQKDRETLLAPVYMTGLF
jgi:predicted AAA+ superfamily ATPase